MSKEITLGDYVKHQLDQLVNLREAELNPQYQNPPDPKFDIYPALEALFFDPDPDPMMEETYCNRIIEHQIQGTGILGIGSVLYDGVTHDLWKAIKFLYEQDVPFIKQKEQFEYIFWRLPWYDSYSDVLLKISSHDYQIKIDPLNDSMQIPRVFLGVTNIFQGTMSSLTIKSNQDNKPTVRLDGMNIHPVMGDIYLLAEAIRKYIIDKVN